MTVAPHVAGPLWAGLLLIAAILYAAFLLAPPLAHLPWTELLAWMTNLVAFALLVGLVPVGHGRVAGWASPLGTFLITGIGSLLVPLYAMNERYLGRWTSGEQWVSETVAAALTLTSLGLLCMAVSYLVFLTRKRPRGPAPAPTQVIAIAPSLGIWTLVVGLLGLTALVESAGGLLFVINNAFARREMFAGTGFLMPVVFLIPVGAAMLLTRAANVRGAGKQYLLLLLATGAVFGLLISLGGRGLAIRGTLLLFCIFHIYVRRISFPVLASSVITAMLLLPVLGDIRSRTRSELALSVEAVVDSAVRAHGEHSGTRWDDLERTVVVLHGVPHVVPYQYFTTLSRVATAFVPRAWWPDKPGLTEAAVYSPLFGVDSGGKYGKYPAGAVGDYYLQAGVLGVIIGYAVQGAALAAMTLSIATRLHRPLWIIGIYIAVVFGAYQLRNLFIFQAVTAIAAYLAVVGLWLLVSRGRR